MKRILSAIFATALCLSVFLSCSNIETFDPQVQLDLEKAQIETYVRQNYPNAAQYQSSGIWYEVLSPGTSNTFQYTPKDTLNETRIFATATVNFTGKLVSDGTVFWQTEDTTVGESISVGLNLSIPRGDYIPAWIYAFYPQTLIVDGQQLPIGHLFANGAQPGARFRIITPSAYAFGQTSVGTIPANSPLDYEIEVLDME